MKTTQKLMTNMFKRQTLMLAFLTAGRLQSCSLFATAVAPRAAFVASRVCSSEVQSSTAGVKPLVLASSAPSEGIDTYAAECDTPSAVVERVFETDKRPVILFDGVCNLCNGAVNLALDWDPSGKLRFSALQSNVGKALLQVNGRAADDISSIVLVTQNGAYIKSDAILRITEALTPLGLLPFKPAAVLGRVLVPRFLRDLIYDGVADNRYDLMGKQDQCRFDADGEFDDRFINDDLALKEQHN